MKSTMDFFPVIEIRSVDVAQNEKDMPEQCCRFQFMDRENAPN